MFTPIICSFGKCLSQRQIKETCENALWLVHAVMGICPFVYFSHKCDASWRKTELHPSDWQSRKSWTVKLVVDCLCSQQILLHYGLVNGLAIKSNVVFNVFNNVMCKLIAFNQENKIFFYKKFFYVYNFFYKFFSLSGLSLFVRELFAMYILYYVSHFSYKRNISCFQPLVVDVNMYCI